MPNDTLPAVEEFTESQKAHFGRNPNDFKPGKGFVAVRIDGGDSKVPSEDRQYTYVRTGFGESARVASALKRAARDNKPLEFDPEVLSEPLSDVAVDFPG